MEDLLKKIKPLKTETQEFFNNPNIRSKQKEIEELKKESEVSDFWDNSGLAQQKMKRLSSLETQINPWNEALEEIDSLEELLSLNDESLNQELNEKIELLGSKIEGLKKELKYNGEFDSNDAIVSIFAGAGGTDAQDWTLMLFRMYSRWVEKSGYGINVIDQNDGEEAGLKSITFEVTGNNIFGKLKGEAGVHRLVRLSPFNADNLRQTSFAKVEIIPRISFNQKIDIEEKDLKIDVFRAGGHGGQSVNTTDSAVRITHIPSGISVSIQNERSQTQNKEVALSILKSKLLSLSQEQHVKKLSDIKGPNQSAEWGNQIRSYVLHPYKQVKDLRTGFISSDPDKILDGDLDGFIEAYLDYAIKAKL